MVVFHVVDAAMVDPTVPGGITNAYNAAADGLYVVGKNAVHQAFFDKIINKDYVLQS